MKKILSFILLTCMALTLIACAKADPKEEKYAEANKLLEQGDYEAAYALFKKLGDYKDAEKKASYFRYMPTGHYVEYFYDGEEETATYTITLNEQNLPATIVEEYNDGYKHTCNYTYNKFGLVEHLECSDTEGAKFSYVATFDANGNYINETITDEDGNVRKFDYTYNEKGQQVKVVTTNAPDTYHSYTIEYDEQGRESKVTYVYEDGTYVEEITYNKEGKISNSSADMNGGKSSRNYHYDEKGRLIEIIHKEDGEDVGFNKITYNDKDKILKEHIRIDDYDYTKNYEYDEKGNAVKVTYSDTEGDSDITTSTYTLVYLPFEYTEKEWSEICYSTQCWDSLHMQ